MPVNCGKASPGVTDVKYADKQKLEESAVRNWSQRPFSLTNQSFALLTIN